VIVAEQTRKMRQFFCGLTGHDSLLHFHAGRISLVCYSCGHESPGWDVNRKGGGGDGEGLEHCAVDAVRDFDGRRSLPSSDPYRSA
jgi:hypothetical protein